MEEHQLLHLKKRILNEISINYKLKIKFFARMTAGALGEER